MGEMCRVEVPITRHLPQSATSCTGLLSKVKRDRGFGRHRSAGSLLQSHVEPGTESLSMCCSLPSLRPAAFPPSSPPPISVGFVRLAQSHTQTITVVVAFHDATFVTGRALPLSRTGLSPAAPGAPLAWNVFERQPLSVITHSTRIPSLAK